MSVEHIWNGTVLTIISDSGASSADLKGQKGDTGPRGPQGPAGVITDAAGNVVVDLSPYYTGTEVDNKIAAAIDGVDLTGYPTEADMAQYVSSALGPYATKEDVENVEVDLTGYATETYVNNKITTHTHDLTNYATKTYVDNTINNLDLDVDLTGYATETYVKTEVAKAQLEGAGVDTSVFATKEDLAAIDVDIDTDNKTIVKDDNGAISTAIGGYKVEGGDSAIFKSNPHNEWGTDLEDIDDHDYEWIIGNFNFSSYYTPSKYFGLATYKVDGTIKSTYKIQCVKETDTCYHLTGRMETNENIEVYFYKTAPYRVDLYWSISNSRENEIEAIGIFDGTTLTTYADTYVPIDANYIPVDGVTTTIQDGKLVALAGGDADLTNFYTKSEVDAKITYGTTDLTAGSSTLATGTLYVVYE